MPSDPTSSQAWIEVRMLNGMVARLCCPHLKRIKGFGGTHIVFGTMTGPNSPRPLIKETKRT